MNEEMIAWVKYLASFCLLFGAAGVTLGVPIAQKEIVLSACNISGNQVLDCNVKQGEVLDYRHIREWTAKEKGKHYQITVSCSGGQILLSWPFKADNVVSLKVHGCLVLGLFSEMTVSSPIPDKLKTLILSDNTINIPFADMVHVNMNFARVPWETNCGQMTLEKLVLSNLHYNIIMSPEDRDRHSHELLMFGLSGAGQHVPTKPCIYPNLRMIDESGSQHMGKYHLRLIPEHSEFPKLELYNMSNNQMGHVPPGFQHLHSKKFPVLKHLDFSNNALTEFEFDFPDGLASCSIKVIDLRNNFITSVPLLATRQLKNIGTVFVDLRQNPLRCNCRLAALWDYLKSQYHKINDTRQKQQMSSITCNNGPLIHGKLPETSLLDIAFDKKCKRHSNESRFAMTAK